MLTSIHLNDVSTQQGRQKVNKVTMDCSVILSLENYTIISSEEIFASFLNLLRQDKLSHYLFYLIERRLRFPTKLQL